MLKIRNFVVTLFCLFFSLQVFSSEKEILRWGSDANSGAPYVFRDAKNPEKIIGLDVDIIEAVAEKLNMKPVFVTRKVIDYGTSRLVGKEQEHLKLELVDSSSENVMNGIAFRMHAFNTHLKALNPLDICYTIEENTFNGNTNIQLMIKDIKIEGGK